MSQSIRKIVFLRLSLCKSRSYIVQASLVTRKTNLDLIQDREIKSSMNSVVPNIAHKQHIVTSQRNPSISTNIKKVSFESDKQVVLLNKLEVALKGHQVDEAWKAYNYFKKIYGFPSHAVMKELIVEMSYSSDPQWLRRACDLVFLMLEEKSDLLQPEFLTKLSLSLARAQMPSPASMIFRLMIEKEMPPRKNIMDLFFLHITKTEIGTYLASNILIQLCHSLDHINAKRSISKQTKLDTVIFNVVLNACVRFGSFFKGQQIVEVMSQYGIIADAHSIVIISQIHEANGQRDELKKFKHCVERVSLAFVHHYMEFYDNLLSLHFKFNDVDAASQLILDLYRFVGSIQNPMDRNSFGKPCVVPIGSHNLKKGLRLQVLPELLQKDSILEVENKNNFYMYKNGKIVLTNKGIAWVILLYRRCGRIRELPKLLVSIQEVGPLQQEDDMSSLVVDACIKMGWLDIAHDILDDMELTGSRLGICLYASLLRGYYANNMIREANAMLKQLKALNLSEVEDKTSFSFSEKLLISGGEFNTVESLIRGVDENDNGVSSRVHELNSSIYFFWKAEMIDDALKTYRTFLAMKIHPTVQTFFIIVSGYSSLEMYREITILWGDIKRQMGSGNLVVNRDLCELLILNFVRGGYFERVMEVIGYMQEFNMFIDKYIFKAEFLKFHKNLYRNISASTSRTEAQNKRIEHVRAFRKWVGIR